MTPERAARFAEALTLDKPVARTRLYWLARATLLSDISQRPAFDRVFAEVFGTRAPEAEAPEGEAREAAPDDRPGTSRQGESGIGAPATGRGEGASKRTRRPYRCWRPTRRSCAPSASTRSTRPSWPRSIG